MSLAAKARTGVKWTTISAVISAISQLLLTSVLAHFLDKRDFGLMAITIFVINFSQLFIDMGISNAIIHKQDVTHKQLSSLYWLNIILGALIFLILYFISPIVATFYNEPELKKIIIITAITFLIQPVGMQFSTLLRKDLRFKEIAIRNIFSRTISLGVGIISGYLGLGVYALVYASLTSAFLDTLLLVIMGRKIHTPSFSFDFRNIKSFLSFGLFQMGEKTINYINSDIDSLVVGKILGIEVLGVYNIAKSFVLKPFQVINPILTRVAFPVMAKVQDDINKLKSIYLKMQNTLAFINFPVFIFMFFYAEAVIILVFGAQWVAAAMPLRILSIYSMIRSTMNPIGSLQLARGRADQGFYWNVTQSVILIATVYIGSNYGLMGVCYSLLMIQSVLFLMSWKVMVKSLCGASLKEFTNSFKKPLALSIIPAIILFPFIWYFIAPNFSFLQSCICLSAYLFLSTVCHLKFNGALIMDLKKLVKQ